MLSALYMAVRNEQKRVRGYVSYPLTRFLSIRPAIDAWGRGVKSAIRKADTAPRSQAKLVSSGFLECGSQSAGQGLFAGAGKRPDQFVRGIRLFDVGDVIFRKLHS